MKLNLNNVKWAEKVTEGRLGAGLHSCLQPAVEISSCGCSLNVLSCLRRVCGRRGMFGPSVTFRRLYERGPASRGLAVDPYGVTLGPDIVLVEATRSGYRVAQRGRLSRIGSELGLSDAVVARLPRVLAQISDELASGNLAKAQLLALGIP